MGHSTRFIYHIASHAKLRVSQALRRMLSRGRHVLFRRIKLLKCKDFCKAPSIDHLDSYGAGEQKIQAECERSLFLSKEDKSEGRTYC